MGTSLSSDPDLREDRLAYSPVPRSVGLARRWAAHVMDEWGQPAIAGDVALVVSELASNALLHVCVPGRLFQVGLLLTPSALRIEVTDACGDCLPEVRTPADGDTCGRGLLLLGALTSRWGVELAGQDKTVWAELDLR